MATPITWRNVNAPSFESANRLITGAGDTLNRGLGTLQAAAQTQADQQLAEQERQLFRDAVATGAQTGDINAVNALLLQSNRSPEQVASMSQQVGGLLNQAGQMTLPEQQRGARQTSAVDMAVADQQKQVDLLTKTFERSAEAKNLQAFEKMATEYGGLDNSNLKDALANDQWFGNLIDFENKSGTQLQNALIDAQNKYSGVPLGVLVGGLKQVNPRDTGLIFTDKEVNTKELDKVLANIANQYNTATTKRAQVESAAKPFLDTINKIRNQEAETNRYYQEQALQRGLNRLKSANTVR